MEKEQGKIVRITNGKAVVQMEVSGECNNCALRESCCALSSDRTRQIEIPIVKNMGNLREGDNITLSFQPQTRIMSAFLVFILPIVFLIAGYFIGLTFFGTEGKAILTGFAGLIVAFTLIWRLNKILAREKSFLPKILKTENS